MTVGPSGRSRTASIYNPFWLFYVLVGAERLEQEDEVLGAIPTHTTLEAYSRLLMPNDMLPDWGDGDWTHSWEWFFAVMVRGGSAYRQGRYLDFAQRLYLQHRGERLNSAVTYCVSAALNWLDDSVPMVSCAIPRSEEVVDDLAVKKIAFRNNRGPQSAYALLNYRDVGPYGRYQRDYLNQQLAAYEEKPHHGHADENAFIALMADQTVLLADGGYRRTFHEGWRADVYHNRVVARLGWPFQDDVLAYVEQNTQYQDVATEKVHFGTFGTLDYSRTRLVDPQRGYTGDRIVLFCVDASTFVVVDSIHIDRSGHKLFLNMWHPDQVLQRGELAEERSHWVVSWPSRIPSARRPGPTNITATC